MLILTLVVWRLTILMSGFTDFVQFLIELSGAKCVLHSPPVWYTETGTDTLLHSPLSVVWYKHVPVCGDKLAICGPVFRIVFALNTHRNKDLSQVVTVANLENRFSSKSIRTNWNQQSLEDAYCWIHLTSVRLHFGKLHFGNTPWKNSLWKPKSENIQCPVVHGRSVTVQIPKWKSDYFRATNQCTRGGRFYWCYAS